ncbi:MAG: outer membrane beta-barrel protein [Gemmatimonadaceae bacterium]
MNRSRLFLAIAVLGVLPLAAGAQLSIKGGLSYGAIPNNSGALPGKLSAHSGVAFGLGLASSGAIGFGIEGLYAQRGFSSSVPGNSQKLQYVDVPVYLRLALPTPAISPFAYVGPQLSYELKCDADGISCPSGRDKMTYAGVIGAGLKFAALHGISVEGRYIYGLSDLKMGTVSNSGNYKTRSFMLLAGIGF